jgi:hypothetical protein
MNVSRRREPSRSWLGSGARGKIEAMKEKRSTAVPAILAVLLLLPLVYVGSYLALLKPQPGSIAWSSWANLSVRRIADYRWGGDYARAAFRPIHSVDQLVRPGYWTYSEADQRELMQMLQTAR